jgi:NTE family protein
MGKKKRIALIISGGGVRGVYAVGVVKNLLPRLWERGEQVDIYCGTSIGGLISCYLASHRHEDPVDQVEGLEDICANLDVKDIFKEDWVAILRFCMEMIGTPKAKFKSFCDTTPLRHFIDRTINWANINRNVDRGDIKLVMLIATSLLTGRPAVFYRENKKQYPKGPNVNTFVQFYKSKLSTKHGMASSSVPILFPFEEIDGDYYSDGGVSLNTPLHPLLCFDHNIKIVVVGLHTLRRQVKKPPRIPVPRLPIVFAKFMHFYLLSNTFLDVARLSRINHLLHETKRGSLDKFKIIPYLYVHPHGDIGKLAEKFWDKNKLFQTAHFKGFLSGLGDVPRPLLGDLLSYIMFNRDYIREIIRMGEQDAAKIDLDKSSTWNKGIPD